MKILIVSQYFWPENFRINDFVLEMQGRGHEVTVLTGLPNYPNGIVYKDYKEDKKYYLNYFGVKVFRVPIIPRGNGVLRLFANYISFVISASLLGPIKLFGNKYDHIIVYEPSPITVGIPAIVLKYIKQAPITFWVLDIWPDTLKAVGIIKSKILLYLINILVKFIYRNCSLILAQSHSFVDIINHQVKGKVDIQYFPNWAEDIFNKKDSAPAIEINNLKNCQFKIMFAGNIGDAQDFPSILDAVEILKKQTNVCWIFVGDGRKAKWVKDECIRRKLDDNVIMLGSFPLEKMPSFFSSSDVLLVTLKNEKIFSMTIPGKIQSYLASGKPILGMLNGEGKDVIIKSGAGFVCNASDSTCLAKSINEMLLLSTKQRLKMGESGKKYYNNEFQKKKLIDRLELWLADIQ